MLQNKYLVILIGVFWLVVMLVFIGMKEYTLANGREVLLKTRPVDPTDLFRGEYVILNYEISQVDLDEILVDGDYNYNSYSYSSFGENGKNKKTYPLKKGDSVSVVLEKDKYENTGIFDVKAVYKNKKPKKSEIYIGGKVESVSEATGMAIIKYGIEQYFVQEGKGREIEDKFRQKKMLVKVAVDKFGKAVVKGLVENKSESKETSIVSSPDRARLASLKSAMSTVISSAIICRDEKKEIMSGGAGESVCGSESVSTWPEASFCNDVFWDVKDGDTDEFKITVSCPDFDFCDGEENAVCTTERCVFSGTCNSR